MTCAARIQVTIDREKLIEMCDRRDEFMPSDDGFIYWWPSGFSGYIAPHQLRWIADELDKRNEPWAANIEEYFRGRADQETSVD